MLTFSHRRALLSVLCFALVLQAAAPVGAQQPDKAERFTFPAEFDRQEAVWLAARPTENGHPTIGIVVEMIKALAPHVRLWVMVADAAARADLERRLADSGVDATGVRYWTTSSSPTRWYRDVGAIFLRGDEGHVKVVDFNFNCYGNCDASSEGARRKEGIDREIAALVSLPVVRTELIGEGGDREFNGRGVMMAVEAVELQRNAGMSRAEIERQLLDLLGQKTMIWLKQGVAEDGRAAEGPVYGNVFVGGTGGHIDEFCRFADPHTILLAEVSRRERDADPVMRMSYERLEENYRILSRARDQDGKRFKIVRVPVPDLMYDEVTLAREDTQELAYFAGSKPGVPMRIVLPTSYLNFFVSNGVVLAAAYWKPGRPRTMKIKDEAAQAILRRVFPGRRIVAIHCEELNYGGGGIHCATQQQPSVTASPVPPRGAPAGADRRRL
jgi:agmatine deiminase